MTQDVDLGVAKRAFKAIVKGRHDRNKTSATADLQSIDAAPILTAVWQVTRDILATLPTPDPQGCCTYTLNNKPFQIRMTRTECDGVPGELNPQFDPDPTHCPQ